MVRVALFTVANNLKKLNCLQLADKTSAAYSGLLLCNKK